MSHIHPYICVIYDITGNKNFVIVSTVNERKLSLPIQVTH